MGFEPQRGDLFLNYLQKKQSTTKIDNGLIFDATYRKPIGLVVTVHVNIPTDVTQVAEPGTERTGLRRTPPIAEVSNVIKAIIVTTAARKS